MHRYLSTRKDYSLPLYPESMGYEWPQEAINRPKGYPYWHWLQTTSGAGEIKIGEHRFSLDPGQGILISPFVPHHYASIKPDPWVTSFFTFGGALAAEITATLGLESYLIFEALTPQIKAFIPHTFPSLQISDEKTYLETSTEIYGFLMNLRATLNSYQSTSVDAQNLIVPLLDFINQHYADSLTNVQLAEKFGYSPQHLTRLFKAHLRVTPLQYLLEIRIRKSKELLINYPHIPIQKIADSVGFNSLSYFTATFKKAEGIAPHQFRKLYR